MRVEDALGQPGRAGRVVELGGVLGERVLGLERVVALRREVLDQQHVLDERRVDALGVRPVGDQQLGAGVRDPVADPLVAVEHRHREQDRAALERGEERRRRLGRRREQHRDAVALLDAVRAQHVREAVRRGLQLAPPDLAHGAAEVLVDHRELVRRMLVAHVGGDVVVLGHLPAVLGEGFLVAGGTAHDSPLLACWTCTRELDILTADEPGADRALLRRLRPRRRRGDGRVLRAGRPVRRPGVQEAARRGAGRDVADAHRRGARAGGRAARVRRPRRLGHRALARALRVPRDRPPGGQRRLRRLPLRRRQDRRARRLVQLPQLGLAGARGPRADPRHAEARPRASCGGARAAHLHAFMAGGG